MTCKKCGFQNPENETFCRKCGEALVENSGNGAPAVNAFTQELKYLGKNKYFILFVISMLLNFIAYIAQLVFSASGDAAEQGDELYGAFQSGRIAKVVVIAGLIMLASTIIKLIGAFYAYGGVNNKLSDAINPSPFSFMKFFHIAITAILVFAIITCIISAVTMAGKVETLVDDWDSVYENVRTYIQENVPNTNADEAVDYLKENRLGLIRAILIVISVGLAIAALFNFYMYVVYSRIQRTCKTGIAAKNKISKAVAMLFVVSALFTMIGLSSLFSTYTGGMLVASVLYTITSASSTLFFGIMLLSYNTIVEKYQRIQSYEQLYFEEEKND